MAKQVKTLNTVSEPDGTNHLPGELVDASKFPDLDWLLRDGHVEQVPDSTPAPDKPSKRAAQVVAPVEAPPAPPAETTTEVSNG